MKSNVICNKCGKSDIHDIKIIFVSTVICFDCFYYDYGHFEYHIGAQNDHNHPTTFNEHPLTIRLQRTQ